MCVGLLVIAEPVKDHKSCSSSSSSEENKNLTVTQGSKKKDFQNKHDHLTFSCFYLEPAGSGTVVAAPLPSNSKADAKSVVVQKQEGSTQAPTPKT